MVSKITAEICTTCHNEKSPFLEPGDTFDCEKKVKDKFIAPTHYAIIFGYVALHVMVDAIVRAKSLNSVAIKDALLKTDYKGLEGQIKFETFENFRNQGRYVPSFIQWKDGKRVAM